MTKAPLECDLGQARNGCRAIADHIIELAEASLGILNLVADTKKTKDTLRAAYILNLVGYEEAGKLFMMWQALADAEREKTNFIRIEDFEFHEPKGNLAGDLCCQMLDVAEGTMGEIVSAIENDKSQPKPPGDILAALALSIVRISVSNHKERVYRIMRNFNQEREDAMYVDFRGGDWTVSPPLSPAMLAMDCILLIVVARAANAYLADGAPFCLATKALSDISKNIQSEESGKFLSILRKHDPQWFGLFNDQDI